MSFKLFCSTLLLSSIANALIQWTPLLNENDENFGFGLESVSKFGTQYGGKGGKQWSDDCDGKGGLKAIQFKCGFYVGSVRLLCGNGKWTKTRGDAKDKGKGKVQTLFTAKTKISKIVINAAKYIDRVTLFNGKKIVLQCGRSKGGKPYTATAPYKKAKLCGLRGRSGWWIDALSPGWCAPKKGKKAKKAKAKCVVKFKTKWPHCTNIKCFKNQKLKDVKKHCKSLKNCNGFSYTAGSPKKGNGCWKQKCKNPAVKGWGQKSHMYYECRNWTRKRPAKKGCKVVLFQHCGYKGYKHVYKKSTRSVRKGANDQYSAVKLFGCKGKQVTLYQHVNFGGKKWTLKGKGDSCFVNNGFNDIVSSVKITSKIKGVKKPNIGSRVTPSKCVVKFKTKWPHCTNIKCFSNQKLTDVQKRCSSLKNCNGFSYTAGAPKKGNGCWKQKCKNPAVKGWGQKSHMYYECNRSKGPKPAKPKQVRKCVVKFKTKWPHCTNIKCFKNQKLTDVQKHCTSIKTCNGFSYTAGAPKKGNGCWKQKCKNPAVKGWGQKSHMYYDCNAVVSVGGSYKKITQMFDDDEIIFADEIDNLDATEQNDDDFDDNNEEFATYPLDMNEFAQVQDGDDAYGSYLRYSGIACGLIGSVGLYVTFKKLREEEDYEKQIFTEYSQLL